MSKQTRVYGALALLAGVSLSACEVKNPIDNVNVILRVSDAPVSLSSVPALSIVAGAPSETTQTVSTGSPVESVDAVTAIKLQPSFFTFTPAPGSLVADGDAGGSSASGTVLIQVRSGNNPLIAVTVTVTNNVVTGVSPSVSTLEQMAAAIKQQADAAIAQNPALANRFGNYQNMTGIALLNNINSVLTQAQSSITVMVYRLSGDVLGTIRINQFTIDATMTASS